MGKYNVLLSYPRSGNTWVRYAVEFISKKPTTAKAVAGTDINDAIGQSVDLGVDLSADPILYKRHRADHKFDKWTRYNSELILLVRDYRECILRNVPLDKLNTEKGVEEAAEKYMHCISHYALFGGKKCMFYYEDLVKKPNIIIDKIISFLKIDKGNHYTEFFDNIERHKLRSLKSYAGISQTFGKDLSFHSRRFGPSLSNKIESSIMKHNKFLFNRYLRGMYGRQ